MSELDRIEEKYGDISRVVLTPTKKTLNQLALRSSRFKASEEYFNLKEHKRYSPDKISDEIIF